MKLYLLPPTMLFGRTDMPSAQLAKCDSPDRMRDLLCEWVVQWMRMSDEKHLTSSRITKAVCYIVDHYTEDISLEGTAGHLYVHPVHLSRQFKAETSSTFTETLNIIRVEKAKLLLAQGSLRISEIAFAVGYNSVQGFHGAFKKLTGFSPADYSRSAE